MILASIRRQSKTVLGFLALSLLIAARAAAGVPATAVWELRQSGSDTSCAGGFDPAKTGTDRSQADSAYKNGTNLTVDGTTNTDVAPDGYTPDGAADPGNFIQITAGSGFSTGFYEITSVVAGKWRLDRSPAATTTAGGTWFMGGGLATFGKINGAAVAGNLVYVKAGVTPFSIASNISNDNAVTWIGYNTTRTPFNTDATLPTINCGANSITMLSVHAGAAGNEVRNLAFNANSKTGATAVDLAHTFANARRCTATGFAVGFHTSWNLNHLDDCYTSGCTTGFQTASNSPVTLTGCVASGGTTGFTISSSQNFLSNCIATGCSGVGFAVGQASSVLTNCSAYGCGGDQFSLNAANIEARNCVAYGGSAKQFNGVATTNHNYLINCAADAGGTGQTANFNSWELGGLITLTANPYTAAGSNDFSLNATAGGGILLKGLAAPTAFTGISTTNGLDIGAVQSGGGGAGGGGFRPRPRTSLFTPVPEFPGRLLQPVIITSKKKAA